MIAVDLGWQAESLCATEPVGVDDFFFEGRWLANSDDYRDHVRRLKAMCARCPVRQKCLDYADETDTRDGFWGGETATERLNRRWPNHRKRRVRERESLSVILAEAKEPDLA